jgi:hypothetical protein
MRKILIKNHAVYSEGTLKLCQVSSEQIKILKTHGAKTKLNNMGS